MPRPVLCLLVLPIADACSCFYMNYTDPHFAISARTEDMADQYSDIITTFPRGRVTSPPNSMSWTAKFGYVGITSPLKGTIAPIDDLDEGMNEKGLSCGALTLIDTAYSLPSADRSKNLYVPYFCRWVLENFALVEEVRSALEGLSVFENPGLNYMQHFSVQDGKKGALVVEWLKGEMKIYSDLNDARTGYGILTNEPPFEWQLRNVQHYDWKKRSSGGGGEGSEAGPAAVSVPGTFYPDERFLRIHILRTAVEQNSPPKGYQEAVAYAVSILNSVQAPPGNSPGIDAHNDHTKWAVVRDHINVRYYVRSTTNPSLQLIDLMKLQPAFKLGSSIRKFPAALSAPASPWFHDISGEFHAGAVEPYIPIFT